MADKIIKDDADWVRDLTSEQYQICRLGGTEPAFSGKYNNDKRTGVYACVCCGFELFDSSAKFDSGTGWPSFTAPMNDGSVETKSDISTGMARTEVLCARCEAHLGHVFEDGPEPTGRRYCMNSASLKLKPRE